MSRSKLSEKSVKSLFTDLVFSATFFYDVRKTVMIDLKLAGYGWVSDCWSNLT